MTTNFTYLTKTVFAKLMLMMAFVFISSNAAAAVIDLGELELDKEYTLQEFKGYKATFTPDRDGILIWETPTGAFLTMYDDEAYTVETPDTHSYIDGGQVRQYKVKAGKTYYIFSDFVWNGGTFKIFFVETLQRVKTMPEENTVFDIAGEGYIELHYNMAVTIDTVLLSVNGEVLDGGDAFVVGSIVGIQLKGENEGELNVRGLIESGVLKEGDKLTFKFTAVSAQNPDMKLEETLTYICPGKPMMLVSDNSDGFALKSFWYPGDDAGKLVLTFDGNLWIPTEDKPGPVVVINFGNAESEDPGDFYHEEFFPTVEGNKLICDFTQKRRRVEDMLTTGNNYGFAIVKVVHVLDENGNYASSPGKGTMGTWNWMFSYEQVDCKIRTEFSPKKKLHSDEKTIELWIGGYSDIRLNEDAGVLFSWMDANGVEQSVKIAAAELDIEVDEGDATINVVVPDAVRESENFKIALVGYTVADGVEHPVEAEYIYIDKPKAVGINGVESTGVVDVKYYDVNGVEIDAFAKGVNIVKTTLADGTVKTTKILKK